MIDWVEALVGEGMKQKAIVAASRARRLGYPGPKGLSDGDASAIYSVLLDRQRRRGERPRRTGPSEGGKRKRQIYTEKSGGEELRELRVKIMNAVMALEHYRLPEDVGLTEEEQADIGQLFDDLTILAKWMELAMSATASNMTDLERQRKRQKLRALADNAGATPAERAAAEIALQRLEASVALLSA